MSPAMAYQKGIYYVHVRNLELAKYYFRMALNSKKFHNQALLQLGGIELSNGRLDQARDILNYYHDDFFQKKFNLLQAKIEQVEYNYQAGIQCLEKDIDEADIKLQLQLAKLYFHIGEKEVTKKILSSLTTGDPFLKNHILFAWVDFYIYTGDYDQAMNMLQKLPFSLLSLREKEQYLDSKYFILYQLGQIDDDFIKKNSIYKLMIAKEEEVLWEHLKKHQDFTGRIRSNSYFYKDIDLRSLMESVKQKLPSMNGKYFGIAEEYIFQEKENVGYCGNNVPTNAFNVVTLWNTSHIITMYPIIVSEQFNQEGLLTNETLKQKRLVKEKRNS